MTGNVEEGTLNIERRRGNVELKTGKQGTGNWYTGNRKLPGLFFFYQGEVAGGSICVEDS